MFIKHLELQAVETHQTVERAQPEVAVVRLDDGDDLIGGQAVARSPGIHMKALPRRRQGRGAGAEGQAPSQDRKPPATPRAAKGSSA